MTFLRVLSQSLIWRGVYFVTLFIVNLVLSRYLQADGSGVVYYISNTFVFVQLVAGLSLENGITYFAAGKRISTNKLLWFCLLWTGIFIILQIVVYSFFSFENQIIPAQQITQYAFCFITGSLLIAYCSNVFYATGNFFVSNLILSLFNLLFSAFAFVAYGWLHSISKNTIVDVYFYTMLLQGVTIAIVCIIKNKSWQEFALPEPAETKKFVRYSLTVLIFNILLFLVYRIDYYFVKFSPVCTPSDLGNYIQASKLGQMLLIIPQIVGSAVYPQVSSGKDMENVSRIILLLIKLAALIFFLVFIFFFFTGNQLFPFLFGYTFSKMRIPFLLLLPGIFGLSVISFLSNYFSGQGNVFISVKAASVALVVVVAGDFVFVPRYGIVAAASVSMIGYLVMCAPYINRFVKDKKLSYLDFFRFQKSDWLLLTSITKRNKND